MRLTARKWGEFYGRLCENRDQPRGAGVGSDRDPQLLDWLGQPENITPLVGPIARRLGLNAADVDEASQEFLLLLKRKPEIIDTFDPGYQHMGRLRKILTHTVIKVLRSRRRHERRRHRGDFALVTANLAAPPVADSRSVQAQELREAIGQLPAMEARVARSRLEGKRLGEIAQELGINRRSLNLILTRIKHRLQRLLS